MAIPQNKQWRGALPGKYAGNLWQTFNIDLEREPGRIVLSDKFRVHQSDKGAVYQFLLTDAGGSSEWWGLVRGNKMINNGSSTIVVGTWDDDDTTNFAGVNTPLDMIIHESVNGEQRLFVAMDDDIAVLNTTATVNTWDVNWGSTIPSIPIPTVSPVLTYRPMARLQRLLAIANKVSGLPKIDTIDSSDNVTLGALTFPSEYTVRLGMAGSDRFWFGLQNDADQDARIIEWDGTSATYNFEYDLDGSFPLTGFIVDDVPYYITEKGYIFKYSGGGFVKVADFNLWPDRIVFGSNVLNEFTIFPHGSFVSGHLVYLNVGMPMVVVTSGTSVPDGTRRGRSGLWIFNTQTLNLYHNASFGLHSTAGTDIDYGHSHLKLPGTVVKTTRGSDKDLFASASVYTGGSDWRSASQNGLYLSTSNSDTGSNAGRNRGYFITSYIPIKDVEAMWEALFVKFKQFFADEGSSTSSNRIIVKWRVQDPLIEADAKDPNANDILLMAATGTWVNTTSFTSKVPKGVVVGNEVEILVGDNAGCSFNVSALSATPDNTSSITVTIDEVAPTSSTDTFLCRFDNWNTETAISSLNQGSEKVPFTSIGHGEFIQLKIELRGFQVEIDELIPVLKTLTSPKQA